jgi:hypothetical protein
LDYTFLMVVAGAESVGTAALMVVAVAGFESVGGLESVGAGALVAAGLVSEGTLESAGVDAFAFTATFTVLQTVLPLTFVQTFLVVNLVAAVAEVAPKGAAKANTATVPRARRMMWFRGLITLKPSQNFELRTINRSRQRLSFGHCLQSALMSLSATGEDDAELP